MMIPRNIDAAPPGAVDLFGSVFGPVPNDGLPHLLPVPAGVPALALDPTYRSRLRRVRVEWSTVDLTLPPPLTLSVVMNGVVGVGFSSLSRVPLQAVAIGTPAAELTVYADAAPGASMAVFVVNTGAVSQLVAAYLTGWAYPTSWRDAEGFQ
jgi:hypothetical protein